MDRGSQWDDASREDRNPKAMEAKRNHQISGQDDMLSVHIDEAPDYVADIKSVCSN